MSLIEKLGGYERAKHEFKMIEEMTPKFPDEVKTNNRLLLEYRRANNIFDVGDKVVYKGKAGLNGLFEIERLTKTGKPKTVKTERFGNFPCRYCEVQHATDSEIQAGRRL